jgi:rhodanese-related sulfurtransferase
MVKEITRDELKEKLNHPKKSVLLEILAPKEYRQAHLPGALNMPPGQVRILAPELIPNTDFEVIVYCAGPTCHASDQAAHELVALGYTKVRHYSGGKDDWIEADLPVVRAERQQGGLATREFSALAGRAAHEL